MTEILQTVQPAGDDIEGHSAKRFAASPDASGEGDRAGQHESSDVEGHGAHHGWVREEDNEEEGSDVEGHSAGCRL